MEFLKSQPLKNKTRKINIAKYITVVGGKQTPKKKRKHIHK
jgi:hypothetical protein